MKKNSLIALSLALALSLTACTSGAPASESSSTPIIEASSSAPTVENKEDLAAKYAHLILEETETTVKFIDGIGNEKIITKNPERTVVLLNSILDLWYLAGGEAVARVTGTANVPAAAVDITDLGSHAKISLEALLELQPDLVLMHNTDSQIKFGEILDENGVEWAVIDTGADAYTSFQENSYIFSKILGTEETFMNDVYPVIKEVEAISAKLMAEENKPTVVSLYTSGKSIKADTELATVGQMLQMIGTENIISIEDLVVEDATRIELSFETLIEKDPEHIFFIIMGDEDGAREKIKTDLESNQAWNDLTAVKNENVHYLPKDLFTYKANAQYATALKHLAEIVHPDVILD